ncbi:MAG: hypothetical protein LKE29_04100 [Acidaminococcaceae bacterium]|jgi:hypothetical protein|nr:hypothetical protein [Acidaminococcaceae bacterium]
MEKMELKSVEIEGYIGGSQSWFKDLWMKMGGCAAVTACDSSIYFAQNFGMKNLYPFDLGRLSKKDYVEFSKIMKPYLKPRFSGIDKLEIYEEGYGEFLRERNEKRITLKGISADVPLKEFTTAAIQQLDKQIPIPCLVLKHKNKKLKNYVWHWFLLMGYEKHEDYVAVKAVTYGSYEWLSLEEIWDSGYEKKGGLIIFGI